MDPVGGLHAGSTPWIHQWYLMSLVVAVPVNHFSAELRKGRRLCFFRPDSGMGLPSNDGCVCSMLLADENTGLYAIKRLCRLSNLTWRGLWSVPRLMCAEMIHECLVG